MSTIKVDTVQSRGAGAVTLTNQIACKHYVRFDQVNSNTMEQSFNNASVTDNGTGVHTFTNTNNMANANHAPTIATEIQSSYQDAADAILSSGITTTGMKGYHVEGNSATDTVTLTMHTWGDLA